jgi:hypothetical protein
MTCRVDLMDQARAMKLFFALILLIGILVGCVHEKKIVHPTKIDESVSPWTNEKYANFIKRNIALKDIKYSNEYTNYEFIVDTEFRSTRIQNLIDISTGESIVASYALDQSPSLNFIDVAYRHVITRYRYAEAPLYWLTIDEIVAKKEGDCKNLSMLLFSILLSKGVDCHAAISNGHMWVNVKRNGKWYVMELDQDTERKKIYSIENFYERPLYKIFKDYTLKRKIYEEK